MRAWSVQGEGTCPDNTDIPARSQPEVSFHGGRCLEGPGTQGPGRPWVRPRRVRLSGIPSGRGPLRPGEAWAARKPPRALGGQRGLPAGGPGWCEQPILTLVNTILHRALGEGGGALTRGGGGSGSAFRRGH